MEKNSDCQYWLLACAVRLFPSYCPMGVALFCCDGLRMKAATIGSKFEQQKRVAEPKIPCSTSTGERARADLT